VNLANPQVLFLALVAAHALCDYPLQGDFLSRAKDRTAPIPGVPWWQALGAHVVIHGAAVAALTGFVALGVLEAAVHWVTDDLKCRGKIGFNTDQAVHIAAKAVWVVAAMALS
jgi:hypothetical protein